MAKGRTLYDRTIDKLKNNKAVVASLIAVAVIGAVVTLAQNVRDLLANLRPDQPGPFIEYSRIILAADQPWESIPRTAPNYFYRQLESLAGTDAAQLRELEAKRADFVCPWMFASEDWCLKVQGFFSQRGLQNIAIDPRFDVLVFNPDDRPVILQGLAIEIAHAEQVTVSLGDWETTRIPVDAAYEIPMPPFPTARGFQLLLPSRNVNRPGAPVGTRHEPRRPCGTQVAAPDIPSKVIRSGWISAGNVGTADLARYDAPFKNRELVSAIAGGME
jgi:hypothetical protein